jgi:hypothetical protein
MQAWPQIRSDDRGHVYVIWFDTRHGGGSVYFRASDDFGRTWREERRVKGEEGDVEGPMELAADAQGHLYIAWADNREGEYGIYLVASADYGRTWSQEVRLDVAKAKASRASLPTLVADPSGTEPLSSPGKSVEKPYRDRREGAGPERSPDLGPLGCLLPPSAGPSCEQSTNSAAVWWH